MKIGDIKLEALGLMFPDEIPAYSTADTMDDGYANILSDYSEILARMTGSLARCLDVIAERRVLPQKYVLLDLRNIGKSRGAYRFDMESLRDFYDISRVGVHVLDRYDGDFPYQIEGTTLFLRDLDDDARVILFYHPFVEPPSVWENDAELEGVPDRLARLIPYFIKGELFREEEPGEAAEAMAWFEGRIAEIAEKRTEKQGKVASVYAQEVL